MDKYLSSQFLPKTDFTKSKFVPSSKINISGGGQSTAGINYTPTSGQSNIVAGPQKPVSAPVVKPATTTTKTEAKPSTKTPSTKAPSTKTAEDTYQEDIRKQIEAAYQAQLGFLGGQEQALGAQLPDYLKAVASPFEQQQPLLEQQLAQQQQMGVTQEEALRQQEQQNLAGIRRLAEEQSQRAVQQFGGVGGSSAAQAAGEIIGREQLKQTGAARTATVQGIQNIQDQLRAIQSEFNANVSKLALQKEQALSQARINFQQQLDAIKKEKALAGVTKAQQTITALQDFATRRRSIEDQVTQQQTNLNLLREQAALNAQNLRLQTGLTPQAPVPLTFGTSGFFTNSNQSNELSKILQAGVASGTLNPFGKSPTGEDLFVDRDGIIVDIKGNKYQQTPQQPQNTSWFNWQ